MDYLKILATERRIPCTEDCWSCYHPPLYYLSALPFWMLGDLSAVFSTTALLQLHSLLLSWATLFAGYWVLTKVVSGPALFWTTALWAFWPTALLSAPRIGNDQLFYLWHILALGFSIKYLLNPKPPGGKYIWGAMLCSGLAYATKSTGIVTIGVAGFSMLLRLGSKPRLKPSTLEVLTLISLGLLISAIGVQKFVLDAPLVGNAAQISPELSVTNTLRNFWYFDVRDFVTTPYASLWEDAGGRQYFGNYLSKTSLYGEFKMLNSNWGHRLAQLTNFSFLLLALLGLHGWWHQRKAGVHWLLLAQLCAMVAASAYLRYQIPFACSNDFRYIFPVLLSTIPFVALGVTSPQTSRGGKFGFRALALIFMAASNILIIAA